MEESWIKLYRQLLCWQHFQEPTVLQVWLVLLLTANAGPGWWRGRRVGRGEVVTSNSMLMSYTGIKSHHTVECALRKLEESGEIRRERFCNATKITIVQYMKYQPSKNQKVESGGGAIDAPHTAPLDAPPDANMAQSRAQGRAINALPTANKQEVENINIINNPGYTAPAPAREVECYSEKIGLETFGVMKNVKLAAAQHRYLVEQYGAEMVGGAVDSLSCELAEGKEQSTNHYATLLRWLRYRSRNDGGGDAKGKPKGGRDMIGKNFVSD